MNYFVIATGQDDNIGDVVLRRRMLEQLQATGTCHVFVSSASNGFLEGLNIGERHVIYRTYQSWLKACVLAALKDDFGLVHNAGEFNGNWHIVKRHLSLLPVTLLARVRRKHAVHVGSGIRGTTGGWMNALKLLVRFDTTSVWRDQLSRSFFGVGHVRPDWAFDASFIAPIEAASTVRRYLAISMRFDRPAPTPAWFDGIALLAQERQLTVVVVSQVIRDNAPGRDIAARLDAEFLPWSDGRSHLAQEAAVREIYRQSECVVSDRLHALVIGLTEGAIPVGAITAPDLKLGRHFAAAGIENVSFDTGKLTEHEIVQRCTSILNRSSSILQSAAVAREAVAWCDRIVTGQEKG